ncbi:MAG TPA: GMP synthase (glutamine-hydrolyzing), partial [archaeon]|nr:GMP synthase (glutamine-hydrolyzing) [archaeon]
RIYDIKSVGVQGDERTYSYPAEIELRLDGKVVWDAEFSKRLSSRITNEVSGVNRVVYVFAKK